jgi:hypothetical protein
MPESVGTDSGTSHAEIDTDEVAPDSGLEAYRGFFNSEASTFTHILQASIDPTVNVLLTAVTSLTTVQRRALLVLIEEYSRLHD